jgi:hypothetical protein
MVSQPTTGPSIRRPTTHPNLVDFVVIFLALVAVGPIAVSAFQLFVEADPRWNPNVDGAGFVLIFAWGFAEVVIPILCVTMLLLMAHNRTRSLAYVLAITRVALDMVMPILRPALDWAQVPLELVLSLYGLPALVTTGAAFVAVSFLRIARAQSQIAVN